MAKTLLRSLGLSIIAVVIVAACRGAEDLTYRDLDVASQVLDLPGASYNGVAWIDADAIALAVSDDEPRIDLVTTAARELRSIQPVTDAGCLNHTVLALTRLPSGELGAVSACEVDAEGRAEVARLITYDPASGQPRSLGAPAQVPVVQTWTQDMKTMIYGVGDALCSVVFERTVADAPLDLVVTAQGRTFNVGQDPSLDPDACPDDGRAASPTFSRGDELAFVASASAGKVGQDRIDLPWALFVRTPDGALAELLDGIRLPRGLSWRDNDRLVWSGVIAGKAGIWSISSDGTDLARISPTQPAWLSISPEGAALVGILESTDPAVEVTQVVTYDLSPL